MMISSDALHLGPLMLPWTLIIVATGLMLLSAVLFGLARKYSWSKQLLGQSQDLLWSSFLLGMLGARLVFVLLNAELYFVAPIDILKIQDKGFHLWGGVLIGTLWYVIRNRQLQTRFKAILLIIFVLWVGLGLAFKSSLKTEAAFPDLAFAGLEQERLGTDKIPLSQFIGQPTVINLWASWCPPCHREMPVLAKAAKQHPQVNFVMLNQGEEVATVNAYLRKHQFQFKHVLLDPYGELPQQLNSFGLPTTLFFNAQGQLVERHMGELSPAMLQQYLNRISDQP